MSTLTYVPVLDGAPYDPVLPGESVDSVALYTGPDRVGVPDGTYSPAVRLSAAAYAFRLPDTLAGRYWPRVTWTSAGLGPLVDDLPPVDLPVRGDLVLSPEALAVRLGIPLPLTSGQRDTLAGSVLDAQAAVEAYLGRPVLPRIVTETRGAALLDVRDLAVQPVLEVLTERPELDVAGVPTGWSVVTYRAGLDTRYDASLRPVALRVAVQASAQHGAMQLWRTIGDGRPTAGSTVGGRRVKSVSAEGQSVSFEAVGPGEVPLAAGSAGVVPGPAPWPEIDRWRIAGREVFQRSGQQGYARQVTAVDEF